MLTIEELKRENDLLKAKLNKANEKIAIMDALKLSNNIQQDNEIKKIKESIIYFIKHGVTIEGIEKGIY